MSPEFEVAVIGGGPAGAAAGRLLAQWGRKSTVSDLLARHLDLDSGRVLLDGRDLRDLPLADIRRHVVTVD